MTQPRVLLIDDDKALTTLLESFLIRNGFDVVTCHDIGFARKSLRHSSFDALVLDIMLPRGSGLDFLRELRRSSPLPVIMLTALNSDLDRITGLELGADDYVPKPCNPRELAARLRAILRRGQRQPSDCVNLHIGCVEYREAEHQVFVNRKPVSLTATEFDLLGLFMREAGCVLSKEHLAQALLGRSLRPFERSIDIRVSNLRRKLGITRDGVSPIVTIHCSGYLFRQAEPV